MDNQLFPDLTASGLQPLYVNPYEAYLAVCHYDSVELQAQYEAHRTAWNGKQTLEFLDPSFSGFSLDPILSKLCSEPGFVDPRNSLCIWARPTLQIKALVGSIQDILRDFAPGLWFMPLESLHMTVLEIVHSVTAEEVSRYVKTLEPKLSEITNHTFKNRAKLARPLLTFDNSAVALSFVPEVHDKDEYTYHHLRRDVFDFVKDSGIKIASRYATPSSHLTIARFITDKDFIRHDSDENEHILDIDRVHGLLTKISDINRWLRKQYWPHTDDAKDPGEDGQWVVGQEFGLDCRMGRIWYGGGETVNLGRGF